MMDKKIEVTKESEKKQVFRISQKVLFFDENNNKFLILKTAIDKSNESKAHKEWMKKYGPWDLPGGRVDERDKNLYEAFAREIKEETGINMENLDIDLCTLELMKNPYIENNGVTIVSLVKYSGAVILSDEHEEIQWLTAEEILGMKKVKPWIKDAVEKAVEKLELQNSLDSWHRCLAEFDNYKKRQAENQKEFTKYAAEGVISDMLPVLDNFHAATDHIPEGEADNPWVTGIMFIQQQMEKVFEDSGVTKIEVNIGDEFDPNIMEAVKNDDDDELTENAKVKKIAQPGYKIGGKVLRPVRVLLSS